MDLTNANEPQKAAIMHLRGPCLVLAGPGSGKTFTITNRILYLLEQGIPPESILVITFMKEAALSMQNRFREMAAASCRSGGNVRAVHTPFYPVNFGTFHSVFYHILKESNTLKSTELLKNSEKKNLILPILKTYEKQQDGQQPEDGQDVSNSLSDDASQILSAIGFYKNTMEMDAAKNKAPARWQPRFADICREYGLAVKRMGRLDFDDMLYECKVLLEENEMCRRYWQQRFRHILIDEFQDINPVQYEAVKLLAASPYNIFAVGDDDQAIYGFRGSQPECLKRFEAEYRARQLLLDVNYRSREEIVQASLKVIEVNQNRFVKQLKAAPGNRTEKREYAAGRKYCEGPVAIRSFAGKEEQYGHMLKEIPAGLDRGESCAVLFRTNSYMQGFAARLKAADISYEMKERVASIYEHFIVTDIMAYLLLSRGEGRREHMLRIMNRPSRYISREAVGEGAADIGRMLNYYTGIQMPADKKNGIKNEIIRLDRQLRSIRDFTLRPAIHYILKAMGYEQYLKELSKGNDEKWQEWQELLEWLKEDAASYPDLKAWQEFQEEYAKALEQGNAESGHPRNRKTGENVKEGRKAVQLLTVHGAKGLEFDRVWIPDCNEKVFPHGTMPDESTVEEERRIFYVAMTRAKKSLELLYLTGTKERPRQPSRFLNPLFEKDLRTARP